MNVVFTVCGGMAPSSPPDGKDSIALTIPNLRTARWLLGPLTAPQLEQRRKMDRRVNDDSYGFHFERRRDRACHRDPCFNYKTGRFTVPEAFLYGMCISG